MSKNVTLIEQMCREGITDLISDLKSRIHQWQGNAQLISDKYVYCYTKPETASSLTWYLDRKKLKGEEKKAAQFILKYPYCSDYLGITKEEKEKYGVSVDGSNITEKMIKLIIDERKGPCSLQEGCMENTLSPEEQKFLSQISGQLPNKENISDILQMIQEDGLEAVRAACEKFRDGKLIKIPFIRAQIRKNHKQAKKPENRLVSGDKARNGYRLTSKCLSACGCADRDIPYDYEIDTVERWLAQGYTEEEILEAMEITGNIKHAPAWPYAEKVLENRRKMHTQEESKILSNLPEKESQEKADLSPEEIKAMEESLKEGLIATLYNYQLPIVEDMKNFLDSGCKMTKYGSMVGSGKTYMTKLFAVMANLKGLRFVYMCQNKSVLLETAQELTQGPSGEYYKAGKNFLYIPAIYDGYVNFFLSSGAIKSNETGHSDSEETEKRAEKNLLKYLEKATRDDYLAAKRCMEITAETADRNTKAGEILYKSAKNALSVWPEIAPLVNVIENPQSKNDPEGDAERTRRFADKERRIRSFVGELCRKVYGNDVNKMIEQENWVRKLYPGTGFLKAKVVGMTFAKAIRSVVNFGAEGSDSFVFDSRPERTNNLVFVDEADRFCTAVLSEMISDAVKHHIDLLMFINNFHTMLGNVYDERAGKLMLQDEMLIRGENESGDDSDPFEATNKRAGELYQKLKDFDNKYHNHFGSSAKYYTAGKEGEISLPVINVNGAGCHILCRERKPHKDGSGKREAYKTVAIGFDPSANEITIHPSDDTSADTKGLGTMVDEAQGCIRGILGLVYQLVENNYVSKNSEDLFRSGRGGRSGITREESLNSVLDRLRINGEEAYFVKQNLLQRRSKTVRSIGPYARGFSVIALQDSSNHIYRTSIYEANINQLPDYKMASMIYNHQKTILSSGTIGLNSIPNLDMKYLEESVMDKIIEKEGKLTDPVVYEMKNIKKTTELIYAEREKEYEKTDTVFDFTVYVREECPAKEEFKMDREAYKAETGTELEIVRNKKGEIENGHEICYLAFAAWAMGRMIKNNMHVGALFGSKNPAPLSDNNVGYYNEKRLMDTARLIERKNGLKEGSVIFQRTNVHNLEAVKNRLKNDEDGICSSKYFLIVSSHDSIGAGPNISYRKWLKDNILSEEFDIDATYIDNVTNVLPQSNEEEKGGISQKLANMLNTEYHVLKFGQIEEHTESFSQSGAWAELPGILENVWAGIPFRKNLYPEDPYSAYRQTVAAKVLQSAGRGERGKKKGPYATLSLTSTVIGNGLLCKELYKDVPTSYLFSKFLDSLIPQKSEVKLLVGDEAKLVQRYTEGNCKFYSQVMDLLGYMEQEKEAGNTISRSIIEKYEGLRGSAFSMGYTDDGHIPHVFSDILTNSGWRAVLGIGDTDYERQKNASIRKDEGRKYKSISEGRSFIRVLDYYSGIGMFGEGWAGLFDGLLKNRKEIETYGFRYAPYTETYFIFLGIFYEKVFEALCMEGGIFDTGRKLVPLPQALTEEADWQVEHTDILVDVKAYSASRKVSTPEKLEKKAKRYRKLYRRKPCFIFVNVKPHDHLIEADDPAEETDDYVVYRINGIGSYSDKTDHIFETAQSRAGAIKKLIERFTF